MSENSFKEFIYTINEFTTKINLNDFFKNNSREIIMSKCLNLAKLLQLGLYYIIQNIPEYTLSEINIINYFNFLLDQHNSTDLSNYLVIIGEFTFMEIISHFNVIRELSLLYNNKNTLLDNYIKLLEITCQNDIILSNIYNNIQNGLILPKSNSISPIFSLIYPIITKSTKYFIPFCNFYTNLIKCKNMNYSSDLINDLIINLSNTISFFKIFIII